MEHQANPSSKTKRDKTRMVKRILETFSNEDHNAMKAAKAKKAKKLGLKRLSWNNYLLHITGVRTHTKVGMMVEKENKQV